MNGDVIEPLSRTSIVSDLRRGVTSLLFLSVQPTTTIMISSATLAMHMVLR